MYSVVDGDGIGSVRMSGTYDRGRGFYIRCATDKEPTASDAATRYPNAASTTVNVRKQGVPVRTRGRY